MTTQITEFRGPYRFLSNFYPAQVLLDGAWYSSVEHAYQAAKSNDEQYRQLVSNCATPGQAKRLGRRCALRPDWEAVKEQVMLRLLQQKFRRGGIAEQLLATGEAELIEGNTWGDTYWGVCNGKGKNRLGSLLMQVRNELLNKRSV